MRYSLNPEFDARLNEAFDQLGLEREVREVILELMDRAALAFSDKVCLRIARCLVEEGLSPEKLSALRVLMSENLVQRYIN